MKLVDGWPESEEEQNEKCMYYFHQNRGGCGDVGEEKAGRKRGCEDMKIS